MKHTQGPWNVVPNDKLIVANNIRHHSEGGYTWNTIAELNNQADAYLIAAAPEMLEELEQLREALNDSVLSTGSQTKDEEMLYYIQKIIKKAKGLT